MTEPEAPTFPADRCPLCGQSNQCAMVTPREDRSTADASAACASCWCRDAQIPEAVVARIPEGARGRACICAQCCNAQSSKLAEGVLQTLDPGAREAILLTNADQRVLIARTGAQVLSWHVNGKDVLWTASAPEYQPNKPVRGGVPIVFPWFGDHKSDPTRPAHGFVRSLQWQLRDTNTSQATLQCRDTDATRALWDHSFTAELTVTLGTSLTLVLAITNTGAQPFWFEEALHTYFATGDIHEASVHGLENVPFVEHAREPEESWDLAAAIRFRAETDRVFQQVPDKLSLDAKTLGRVVTLASNNSNSTIVWNPWPNKTARLSQMQKDDWRHFVCIETANVGSNTVRLDPGLRHEMSLTLSVANH